MYNQATQRLTAFKFLYFATTSPSLLLLLSLSFSAASRLAPAASRSFRPSTVELR